MRTITCSMAKTCHACGKLNTLLTWTASIPDWKIGCSHCGATLVEARQKPSAASDDPHAVPIGRAVRPPVPAADTGTSLRRRASRNADPDRRLLLRAAGRRIRSKASAGAALLTACGLAFALLIAERGKTHEGAVGIELAETGVPAALPAGHVPASAGRPHGALPNVLMPRAAQNPGDVIRTAEAETPVIPRYRLAAERMMQGPEAYPDPREGMIHLQLAALADPEADAEEEATLGLSPGKRREIQRRLRLADHDPKGLDGIFGPSTRAAIAAWQKEANIPATGYVTKRTLQRLVAGTDAAYRDWRAAVAARREREKQMAAATPIPRPQPISDSCGRLDSGEIAYGESVRCDVRGLRENLGAVGRTLAEVFGGTERSTSFTMHRNADGASRL